MGYEEIKKRLESDMRLRLSEKRLRHTLGVRDTALKLAEKYGGDPVKAEIAALAHDLYRGLKGEDLDRTVRELGLDDKYLGNPNLAHGKIAAIKLRTDYGIEDEDIINAVSYHTTGRRGMGLLEKIIFLADAIEPGRDYPGLEKVREAASRSLEEGCLASMLGTIKHVKDQGAYLDDDTIKAAEYLKENR